MVSLIKPVRLHDAGANPGDRLTWNGSEWAPAAPSSGADGNGIYTGSGTIPAGAGATVTSSSFFRFRYNGGTTALNIADATNSVVMQSKNTQQQVGVDDTQVTISVVSGGAYVTDLGGSREATGVLEARSTTKAFYPPRMSTTQRNAITSPADGAIIYDTTTDFLNLRSNGAWVQLQSGGDGDGIYTGSGTVPTAVTATLTDSIEFNYATTDPALEIDGTAGVTITSPNGDGQILTNNTNSQVYFDGKGLLVDISKSRFNNRLELIDTFSIKNPITPTTLSGSQNDYAPAGGSTSGVWRIGSTLAVNITGINIGQTDGQFIVLDNIGSFTITLKNQDAASTATNRFSLVTDLLLLAGMSAQLQYDNNSQRWRCIAVGYQAPPATGTGGIYGGSGTIATAVDATTTTNSFFRIKYGSNANPALLIDDNSGSPVVWLRSRTQSGGVGTGITLTNSLLSIAGASGGFPVPTLNIDASKIYTSDGTPVYLDFEGNNTLSSVAALQVDSTTHVFLPPRMTTAQRTTITSPPDGSMVYDTDLDTISLRANGAWASLAAGGVTGTGSANHIAYWTGSGVLSFDTDMQFNGTEIGFGGAPVTGAKLAVNGFTRVTGVIESRGTGSTFTSGTAESAIRLVNTTATFGKTWVWGSKDDGGLTLAQTDLSTVLNVETGTGYWDHKYSHGYTGTISPASLGADQNNYNLGDSGQASVVRLTSSTIVTITGITGGVAGRVIYLFNIGANLIRLGAESGSSTAANRIVAPGTVQIPAGAGLKLWYDGTSSRWRVVMGATI